MPREKLLVGEHMAGGLNLAAGEKNVGEEQNIESRHMSYSPDGAVVASLGYSMPSAWTVAETGEGIDGLYEMGEYPLVFKAVNGKILYTNATTVDWMEADTGISLTKDNPVFFTEFRGNIYYCNGVEDAGVIAVGRLDTAITVASTTIELADDNGFRFNNGVDKVYIEGDEIDYTAVSTDDLTTVTNITASHDADTYVTQARTITAPASTSLKCKTMAMWQSTLWLGGLSDFPGAIPYSKSTTNIGNVDNVKDFTDDNNYLLRKGAVTALLPTRDRLYVFSEKEVYYITIEITSNGLRVFSEIRLFTPNYGTPNAFTVEEMEDVVTFYTGDRFIRIGYDPDIDQLLPDEKFDEEVYPILDISRRYPQTAARLKYIPHEKKNRLTLNIDGKLKTITYDNRLDEYSYPDEQDVAFYVAFDGFTYFGNPDDDKVYRVGGDYEADGLAVPHSYTTGRYDLGDRNSKFFRDGVIEGFIGANTTINFEVLINDVVVGGIRTITGQTHGDLASNAKAIGDLLVGSGTEVGGGGDTTALYPFRYPFVIAGRGEDIKLRFSSFTEGSTWAIDKWQVSVVLFDDVPDTAY